MRLLAIVAATGILAAGAAFAQGPTPEEGVARTTPQPEAREPNPEDDRKICRSIIPTGSRLGKEKVCKTRAEWEQLASDTKNTTEGFQRKAYMSKE
ncbi:MAG TPA: hypothetical protein VEB20_16135 [Azospirillaceae bacterium]|nr:hypothetical protein [Azospirillaceae bacterium]